MAHAQFDVIFDNGGGTTLQIGKHRFTHHYDNPAQAAEDAKVFIETGYSRDWEGDEPEAHMEYDADTERNGGYRWVSGDTIRAAIKSKIISGSFGHNFGEFFKALGVSTPDYD